MAKTNWTNAQLDAIWADGGDLLVSAAAGSGKTAVLTQRAVRLMTGEQPVDANRLLIATFTKAAAGEMRRRIRRELAELVAQQPDDSFLRRQMRLLESAEIGTVHAFCQRLIRQHFERLGLPPGFRLLGEEEAALLKGEVADAVVQAAYSTGGGVFRELVELISYASSDSKVAETVINIYEFVSAHPFYHHWMDEKLALYSETCGAADSIWGRALINYAKSAVDHCILENAQLIEQCGEDAVLIEKYLPAIETDRELLASLKAALEKGTWEKIASQFKAAEFCRIGSIRGEHPTKEAVKAGRNDIKSIIIKLKGSFVLSEADFREDIEELLPKISCLFELVKRFDLEYSELKRHRAALDFTDLEQMAIRLLIERREDGSFAPTDIALELRGRYDAVMVDEYQDINSAQDMVFKAVSRGDNLFMVGDVKQSIYRFRQASPELFIAKLDSFLPVGSGFPAVVRLLNNFRSRPEVTRVVNGFFSLLMSRETGETDYTKEEYLIPADGSPLHSAGAELILIDSAADEESGAVEQEARYVASHIRQLIDSGAHVREGEATRPVRPEDIALLLAAPRMSAHHFLRALEAQGVPCISARRPEFLASYEISPVVGLLAALDNPLRELELSAALLSPLFGLTPDELMALKTDFGSDGLYASLSGAGKHGGEPFAGVFELFEELRRLSLMLPPHELLTSIYERTNYEITVGMMQQGEKRLGNLRLLVDYAAQEEERGRHTLSDFVSYLDRLAERGQDLTAASVGGVSGVAIMSIHQSKGLEYPVVYVCRLSKAINRTDLRERTILHPEYGFACVRRDTARRIQYDSLPFMAVKLESERALMSEELRKLYVAMTRAKDKLVMTCVLKEPHKRLEAPAVTLTRQGGLPPYLVRSARSVADWLLLCLPHMGQGEGVGRPVVTVEDAAIRALLLEETNQAAPEAQVDSEITNKLAPRLDFIYPFAEATQTPAKLSVSQLTKTDASARFLKRPGFISSSGGLSPTERGNAIHLFMQLCDYNRAADDPEAECRRLLDKGLLGKWQAKAVDKERIRAFFRSSLGERVLSSRRVLREFEFVAPAGKKLVSEYLTGIDMGNEQIMVQGIADCIFFEGERAVLLDYKTDYATNPEMLALRYCAQLSLYRALLPAFLGVQIDECYIYAFHLQTQIAL